MKIYNLGLSAAESLTLCTLSRCVGLCVNFHLLPEEASLIWGDQGTDLQVQEYVIGSHLIAMSL